MMRPKPRAIIAGARRCARKNGASRFSLIVASQSSSVTSRIDFRRLVPAADTSISGAPKDSPARAAHSLSEARSARSQGRLAARPPALPISSRTASSMEARRATSTTAAPAPANASAMVRPMPELAPVTTATRPERSNKLVRDMRGQLSTGTPRSKRSCAKYFASRSSAVRA